MKEQPGYWMESGGASGSKGMDRGHHIRSAVHDLHLFDRWTDFRYEMVIAWLTALTGIRKTMVGRVWFGDVTDSLNSDLHRHV